MAYLDIYQALIESRPYKAGMAHQDAMTILRQMGNLEKIDISIIEDIDRAYKQGCFGELEGEYFK